MSGEFGNYNGGYFYDKACQMADDADCGSYEVTRQWAKVLRAFTDVAWGIAWSEARDSTEATSIAMSVENLPKIKAALREVEVYLAPFEQVAQEAAREAVKKALAEQGEQRP